MNANDVKLNSNLGLHPIICAGVLASLVEELGEERTNRIASESWVVDLENWYNFAVDVLLIPGAPAGNDEAIQAIFPKARELMFQVVRIVNQQEHLAPLEGTNTTDDEAIQALSASAMTLGSGNPWAQNDCLSDSLLQLLIDVGVVGAHVTPAERQIACKGLRNHLNMHDALCPRDIS